MTPAAAEAVGDLAIAQRRYLARNLGPQDAEDMVQEVYLAVAGAIGKGREIRNLPAYVRSTARNVLLTEIRRRQSLRREAPLDTQVRDAGPNPEQLALENEKREIACQVIARLPERSRQLLARPTACGHSRTRLAKYRAIVQARRELERLEKRRRFALCSKAA